LRPPPGVCRTDLHIPDGELRSPILPLIPGHEIVGRVMAIGKNVHGITPGQPVGVPWLGQMGNAVEPTFDGIADAGHFLQNTHGTQVAQLIIDRG